MEKKLHFTVLATPVGRLGLVANERGLVFVDFLGYTVEKYRDLLVRKYPFWEIIYEGEFVQQGAKQIKEYFQGSRTSFDCPLDFQGTEFQVKVWQTLQTIPFGHTCSYKDIAIKLDNPKGVRAVGQANRRNPLPIVVPCHRVIANSGKLGGYSGGLPIKEFLLNWEAKVRNG